MAHSSKKILIINAGSSSIKFKVFNENHLSVLASGLCERIFLDGNFKMKLSKTTFEHNYNMPNHEKAIEIILENLIQHKIISSINDIVAIGHRGVQCGTEYSDSTIVDSKLIKVMHHYIKLAPLHNEPEVKVIEIFRKKLPKVMQLVAFDTSFHTTMPRINYAYALDRGLCSKYEIRRYGMHGTSYKYITEKMTDVLDKDQPNLIICHIGNGASICAVKEGKSYNTSMGLTPLEGLVMGTRCGDIDPSIPLYLLSQGLDADQIQKEMNNNAGLKGLCGCADVRDVSALANSGNREARFALDLYQQRVADYIVRYANDLEDDVDAIVFTAGVGENDPTFRQGVIDRIKILDLRIVEKLNVRGEYYDGYKVISHRRSQYPIYCVNTDEELMIAKDIKKQLNKIKSDSKD